MQEEINKVAEEMARERRRRTSLARETLAGASLKLLVTILPSPADLRRMAAYVNVDKIKSTEDPRELSSHFSEVEQALNLMASTLEVFHEGERGVPGAEHTLPRENDVLSLRGNGDDKISSLP